MLPSLKHVLHVSSSVLITLFSSNGFFHLRQTLASLYEMHEAGELLYSALRFSEKLFIYLKSTKVSLRTEDSVDIWLRLSLLEPDRSKDLTL